MRKNTVQAQQLIKNVIQTPLHRKQPFDGGMLILSAMA